MPITLDGTAGITNDATDLNYTGTLTGGTGVINIGSGQVYKDASGNVGIGTSSPVRKFHVNSGTANAVSVFESTDATAYIQFLDPSGSGAIGTTSAGDGLRFWRGDGATEAMRIDSSGNLLVGTTSVQTGVASDPVGISLYGATARGVGVFMRDITTALYVGNKAASGGLVQFYCNNASVGLISSNGTGTTYGTSSDYRLKEDIAPMTGALAKVAQLKPCTYTWKSTGEQSQGFIAHELQEVVPECVTGEKDAVDAEGNPVYQGIDTSFLVATLTAAIKEQQAIIEQLKADVAALKGAQA
jgi:hypothetical protein